MITRWWLLALISALALPLTSCSGRSSDLQSGGPDTFECSGTLGTFTVQVTPSPDGTYYQMEIQPESLNASGDVVSIYLVNGSPRNYRPLVTETVVQDGYAISAGTLTDTDYQNFNLLAIVPFDNSGATFFEQSPETDTICDLPMPGTTSGY